MDHCSYQNDIDIYVYFFVYFLATKLTFKTFDKKFTCAIEIHECRYQLTVYRDLESKQSEFFFSFSRFN